MHELNEQIDSILENSLDEYYKASDLKGFAKRDLTDKEEEDLAAIAKARADAAAEAEEDEKNTPSGLYGPDDKPLTKGDIDRLEEGDLVEIVIDLDELKQNSLNESFLAMFGGWVEQILGSMFSGKSLPVSVKGSKRDVESFAKALGGEKSYLEAARHYGLDHPTTYKNKSKLETAIKGFEKDTGIKWPFK